MIKYSEIITLYAQLQFFVIPPPFLSFFNPKWKWITFLSAHKYEEKLDNFNFLLLSPPLLLTYHPIVKTNKHRFFNRETKERKIFAFTRTEHRYPIATISLVSRERKR